MDGKLSCDENNNPTTHPEKKDDEDIDRCCHSKFCFSRDMSAKEETLLRPTGPGTSTITDTNRKPFKKCVRFDRLSPLFITSNGISNEDDSDNDNLRHSTVFKDFDISDSESASLSESEVSIANTRLTETMLCQSEVISDAEEKLVEVVKQLELLWLNSQASDSGTPIITKGNKNQNLPQIVSLIAFITGKLTAEYRSYVNATTDPDRLNNLQSTNDLLQEELNNAKNKIHCLEAELKYFSKENALLNTEAKEMAYKMASSGFNRGNKEKTTTNSIKSPEAEIFYKNPHPRFDPTDSKSSAVFDESRFFPNRLPNNGNGSSNIESHNEMLVLKRENEMDSLIRDFHEKFRTNNSSLYAQVQIHDEQIENWNKLMHSTNEEKHQMLQDLVKIVAEHKAVLKERDHYEFILKLLIQEKGNDDFDVGGLLAHLIIRMQESSDDSGSWIQTSLLEGAVQSLQQQNAAQREEIYRLKHLLSDSQMHSQVQENELEDCNKKIAQFLDELNSNDAKLKITQEDAHTKCDKVQELCNEAVAAKTGLECKLSAKEVEVKELQELLKGMRKTNKRHHKKFQELQKTNLILIKEIEESKGNMDHLAEIISQLRSGLKEQKSQWNERLRISSEEASQNKQHCEWLKCQIEQLSQQLKDALDRLKLYEMDKVQLAQQLLLADEERRVVDRKLQELRTALQGDTGLREALIERNEALQMEINRLRVAKTNANKVGAETSPPMEMLKTDEILLSTALFPPTEIHNDKFSIKKNCYTANYRRTNDIPRTAVSLHNGGVK